MTAEEVELLIAEAVEIGAAEPTMNVLGVFRKALVACRKDGRIRRTVTPQWRSVQALGNWPDRYGRALLARTRKPEPVPPQPSPQPVPSRADEPQLPRRIAEQVCMGLKGPLDELSQAVSQIAGVQGCHAAILAELQGKVTWIEHVLSRVAAELGCTIPPLPNPEELGCTISSRPIHEESSPAVPYEPERKELPKIRIHVIAALGSQLEDLRRFVRDEVKDDRVEITGASAQEQLGRTLPDPATTAIVVWNRFNNHALTNKLRKIKHGIIFINPSEGVNELKNKIREIIATQRNRSR
jgi:hypothetical protein